MKSVALLFTVMLVASNVYAQEESLPAQSIRVFFDCRFSCDTQFIRDELHIVDFLNERTQADVHVLHASQRTAAGGALVTLTFMGQRDYAALTDTLTYSTLGDATRDEGRNALLHHLTLGLSRYLLKAGLSDKLVIRAVEKRADEPEASSIEADPWNYWVFSLGGGGFLNGQATTNTSTKRANISANRTTEDLKIRLSGNLSDSQSDFDTGDEIIHSFRKSESLSGQVVKSIGKQWSAGVFGSLLTNSYRNLKLEAGIGPAIEYNFFPYTESTRKFLTVQYNIRISKRNYNQLTIYALTEETILRHSLGIRLQLTQKWGSVTLSTTGNQMLTNFQRSLTDSYNASVFSSFSVRLFRGFSFNGFASYSRIRDQIDLPSDEATKDEILLQSVQLPTGYTYFINFGFSYRFGSIFNNVVNPRMGGGGGSQIFF